jgi:hypothetical protein
LDALDGSELVVVREHLEACSECMAEVGGLAEIAASLALSVPQLEPAPELRNRILSVARRSDTPPADELTSAPPLTPLGGASNPDAMVDSSPSEPSAVALPTTEPAGEAGVVPAPIKPRRPFPWANLSGAVAAAVAVVAMWWGVTQQARIDTLSAEVQRLTERSTRYDYVVRVLAAPAYQQRELVATDAGSAWGRVYFDSDSGRGMLMVHNLPQLTDGATYQVWLNREGGKRVSAAFLRTDAQGFGYTLLRVDEPIGSYQTLGVTREPEGGSKAPTGPPLVRAELRRL